MPDHGLILAPDAAQSQLARNLDICLTEPRRNANVADFLFAGLGHNPLHADFPLRVDALARADNLLCINLYRRISGRPNPLCPASAQHGGAPERPDGEVEEDIIFFPVALVDGFVFGYFASRRACRNTPPAPIDPWTDASFGRFAFHTKSHAFYMVVHGGTAPHIGLRVKFPRGADYTDFLDVTVPPGDYGRSALPQTSPLIVSTPKFPNNSIVKHEATSAARQSMSALIDAVVTECAGHGATARAAGAGTVFGAQPGSPDAPRQRDTFDEALQWLAHSLCKNSYSPGLRSDAAGGVISFSGQCEYFVTAVHGARKRAMRAQLVDAMQLATFFTLLSEPYIALARPERGARAGAGAAIGKARRKKGRRRMRELDVSVISELPVGDEGRCPM